jgi:uncharacterized protein (TIGR00299 family) protein
MSRVLYFDCFSGISGDMVLGAFLDAGLPFEELRAALGSLTLSDVEVESRKVLRAGLSATKFIVREDARAGDGHGHSHGAGGSVHADHRHPHRRLSEIFAVVDRSALSESGRSRAKALFTRLAEVEAAIHQTPLADVHLHEVGATDSIVDIVGAVYALEWANADRIECSPLNVGGGTIESAHGRLPVPAPATLRLLAERAAPIYSGAVQQELVTPTGALIATSYATAFGAVPSMTVERIGYGAGDRDPRGAPNVLRLMVGTAPAGDRDDERVVVIECEIDDMNPQIFGIAMERLYAAGALEVFYVPIQMKKNRPGTLLTVVGRPAQRQALTEVVFRETTTIGVRFSEVARECLSRETIDVETPVGRVRFKIAQRGGRVVNSMPEFDDCVRIAAERNLAVKDVQAIALRAYGDREAHR